jgi:hypothetical protein
MDVTSWATILGVGTTILGVFFAFFRFVASGTEAIRTEMGEQLRIARNEGEARITKMAETEMRSRNAMIGNVTAVTKKIDADLDRLKRESVRREEMASLEARMNGILMKIETKLDYLVEKLGDWRGLEAQIKLTGERLDGISKRLERNDL